MMNNTIRSNINSKIIVIKFGGSIMDSEISINKFVINLCEIQKSGYFPVVVHGGGKAISKRLNEMNIKTEFHNGYRITCRNSINEIEMILSGKINKELLTIFSKYNLDAIGLCGKSLNLFNVEMKKDENVNLGYVGEINMVNNKILNLLISKNIIPIISPIGIDKNLNTLNINADDVAREVAISLKAESLIYLTDVDGIYLDIDKPETRISKIDVISLKKMVETKVLKGGILPKVNGCINAVNNGVKNCYIVNGNSKNGTLNCIFDNEIEGTTIGKGI